jgi:hypothetical protein
MWPERIDFQVGTMRAVDISGQGRHLSVTEKPKAGKTPKIGKPAKKPAQSPSVIEKRGGQTTPKIAPIPPKSVAAPKAPPPGKAKS